MTDNKHDTPPLLSINNLKKIFATPDQGGKTVLPCLNFEVWPSDFICILGPSGCGKSTLLRCIASFENYEGNIFLQKELLQRPGADRIMVFQDFNQLFPWKTIKENIKYPFIVQKIHDKKTINEIASIYLAKVGLAEFGNYYPHQLSGGMKQRAAIARAIALKPQIILMDEPFASLDAITRGNLQQELLDVTDGENITVLFVTHNIQEALVLSSRIMVMAATGAIIIDEANEIERPATPKSSNFAKLWDRYSFALGKKFTH